MQDLPDPTQLNPTNSTDPNDDQNQTTSTDDMGSKPNDVSVSGGDVGQLQKEQEPIAPTETATLEEMMPEMHIAPELTDIGIEPISDQIDLPSDVKKSGVESVGPSQPVVNMPQVNLPISDDTVVQGKHAKIMSSFYWLYLWCVRQLQKAHLHLRKIGGKVVRERD